MSESKFDMLSMFSNASKMQEEMAKIQEEAKNKTVEASAGGGMVNVSVNGLGELVSIKIEPQAVDPRDVLMLEELIKSSVNEGVKKSREIIKNDYMSKLKDTLPFPLPGFLQPK